MACSFKRGDVVICIHNEAIAIYGSMTGVLTKGKAYRVSYTIGSSDEPYLCLEETDGKWNFYPGRFMKLEDVCVGTLEWNPTGEDANARG